ncbi:YpmS family protein [Planococcus sp. CP5-4]|uniref:YpmS family protein n=1 Tax=unclassified Planococcus (in: firmicutes) TaxID=2662419 RepID=UPI001C21BAF2|nr:MULTISPECIES: YpmS family protein [unclassified Planococcus (in: firmicutes)]MBU9674810.1 YpmS family protein [Planococcus sp. CP5-4_YE]MBV0910557.1 YpmS family protein [Planococcus sp. CP5-4_UN]MBW6065364.1 YpmS family protein [Planococcus sp. CP5-4]
MKKWRFAFLVLLVLNLVAVIGFFLFITTPSDNFRAYQAESSPPPEGNTVVVNATKADFEGIANTYIAEAMEGQPIPLRLAVTDHVSLSTELTIFGVTLPILLTFDPVVLPDGNLLLEQRSVEVGQLDIPPESALKLLRDSVDLPEFMEVMPKEEEVLLNLTEIPINGGVSVRAASFDLEEDDIRLLVTIQP